MATGLPIAATEKILAFLDVGGGAPSSSSEPPSPSAPPQSPSAGTGAAVPPPSNYVPRDTEGRPREQGTTTAIQPDDPARPRLNLPPTTEYLLTDSQSPSFDVIDHTLGRDFCTELRAEVEDRGWLDGLRPASTAMDVEADTLGIGPLIGMEAASSGSVEQRQNHTQTAPRGDLSTFVPREARRDPKFRLANPRLHELVTGIQSEVVRRCGDSARVGDLRLRFDETMTSIQISRYPGNGSYYVRHCDRGATCASPEDLELDLRLSSSSSSAADVEGTEREPPQRLVTAVYYLNEEDWSPERDGGSLRVYPPKRRRRRRGHGDANGDEQEQRTEREEQHHDVEPLSDRLVLFRSDLVEHEVLPCFRTRLAVTVWIYGWLVPVTGTCGEMRMPPPLSSSVDGAADCGTESARRGANGEGAIYESRSKEEVPMVHPDTANGGSKRQDERGPSGPPPLPISGSHKEGTEIVRSAAGSVDSGHEGSVFVAIPSYRDSEIYPTIRDLIDKATAFDRIFVGVVLQIDTTSSPAEDDSSPSNVRSLPGGETDEKSLRQNLPTEWSRSNLRVVTVHNRHSTGPCWARSVAQGLWRGEDFVLQIDSHMRFRRNWDTYLIQQLGRCPNPKRSVLTTYPRGYNLPNEVPDDVRPTVLVPWRFDDDGMLRQRGRLLKDATSGDDDAGTSSGGDDNNIPSPLWAAGFNFATNDALLMCPYDPNLHHLFFGEELSMAVRLFTQGFDFFAPPTAVCYHLWSRDHRPTFRETADCVDGSEEARKKKEMKERSMAIVLDQLRGRGRGLGDVRTVEEFAERVGVDFDTRTLSPDAENANIDPSRFVESAFPGDLLSSLTEKVVQSTPSSVP